MDIKGELLSQIGPPQPYLIGRERFSPEAFLSNLEFALKNRKFMSSVIGVLSLWSAVANPLNTPDPTPYLRDLMFGPKLERIEESPSLLDRKIPEIMKILPQNQKFPSDNTTPEESIPEYLESFARNPERIKNTLRWKSLVEQVVADKRLNIALKDRQNWVNRMLKIIFIESEGDPNADPADKIKDPEKSAAARPYSAKGLTQTLPPTANELAGKALSEEEIKNPLLNLQLGTKYQLQLANLYGEELGVWAHHLGMGNMNSALRSYLVSELKLPIQELDDIFKDSTNQLLPKYIKRYQITPEKMLNSPAVTGKLKAINAWGDTTWEYYDRYQAAGIGMGLKNAA